MKTWKLTPLIAAIALLFLGCSQAIDVSAERTKLLETDSEFAEMSVNQGTVEAYKVYLADEALQLPAGLEPEVGKQAIISRMEGTKNLYVLEWTPHDGGVANSGELGWTWGEYTLYYMGKNNEMKTDHGKYLDIWKKQDDGSWKVIVDMGNQSPAPLPEGELEER